MGHRRLRGSALAFALAGMLSLVTVLPGSAASSTVVVTAADLEPGQLPAAAASNKWFFYNDQNGGSDGVEGLNNALGTFVVGPTGPGLLGVGSAEVAVSGDKRRNLATYQFRGTPLASITTLKYSTYNASATNANGNQNEAGYLQFNVDFNGTDTWQRRLTFLPKDNGIVTPNTWKEWDAIAGGAAKWRYSGPTWPGTGISGSTPRTWNDILTSYSGVRIRMTDAFLGIRVGEPYADGYVENIDGIKFGTSAGTTTFDFEPTIGPPTNKDQCKNDGWKQFNTPKFKNQGDCVSYTNNGR